MATARKSLVSSSRNLVTASQSRFLLHLQPRILGSGCQALCIRPSPKCSLRGGGKGRRSFTESTGNPACVEYVWQPTMCPKEEKIPQRKVWVLELTAQLRGKVRLLDGDRR